MVTKPKPKPKPAKRPATPADWHGASKTCDISQGDRIKLLVGFNPMKRGSAEAGVFALYHDGMSIADFIRAGGSREHLAHDSSKGYVTVHDPAVYARLAAAGASPVTARSVTLKMRKSADATQAETTPA
jgi:hypothetical protein